MNKIIDLFITENKEFYFSGEILKQYDMHGQILQYVKINKFIVHKRKDGTKYFCVNFNSLIYKSKNWTLNVEVLGEIYKKE